jgi:hypothetical protein
MVLAIYTQIVCNASRIHCAVGVSPAGTVCRELDPTVQNLVSCRNVIWMLETRQRHSSPSIRRNASIVRTTFPAINASPTTRASGSLTKPIAPDAEGNSMFHDAVYFVAVAHCLPHRFAGAVQTTGECPMPCNERRGCSSCLGEPGRCTWCEETQTCFVFSSYIGKIDRFAFQLFTSFDQKPIFLAVVYQFGMCREWVDVEPQSHVEGGILSGRPSLRGDLGGLPDTLVMMGTGKSLSSVNGSRNGISAGRCKSCERKQSCSSCLIDLGCGWCYYSNNPMIGVCKPGDFHSPAAGKIEL